MEMQPTRRALHAVAELVLAGPQYRTSGTIRLRPVAGGFATVAAPEVWLDGTDVVLGENRVGVDGRSAAQIAAAVGLTATELTDVYHDGAGVSPDEVLHLDAAAAARMTGALVTGEAALLAFAPDQTPVLWPEHFDVGITVDEVNYGVSPGDGFLDEPYVYVAPWTARTGEFWNAPFGAARPVGEEPDVTALVSFFEAGRQAAQ
jgi:hypothetical protein